MDIFGIVFLQEYILALVDIFVHMLYQIYHLFITLFQLFLLEFHLHGLHQDILQKRYFQWGWQHQ